MHRFGENYVIACYDILARLLLRLAVWYETTWRDVRLGRRGERW